MTDIYTSVLTKNACYKQLLADLFLTDNAYPAIPLLFTPAELLASVIQ